MLLWIMTESIDVMWAVHKWQNVITTTTVTAAMIIINNNNMSTGRNKWSGGGESRWHGFNSYWNVGKKWLFFFLRPPKIMYAYDDRNVLYIKHRTRVIIPYGVYRVIYYYYASGAEFCFSFNLSTVFISENSGVNLSI